MADQFQKELTATSLPDGLREQGKLIFGLTPEQAHGQQYFHLWREGSDPDETAMLGALFQSAIATNAIDGIPWDTIAELFLSYRRGEGSMQEAFDNLVAKNLVRFDPYKKTFTLSPQLIESILEDYEINDPNQHPTWGSGDTFRKEVELQRNITRSESKKYRMLGGTLSEDEQTEVQDSFSFQLPSTSAAEYLVSHNIDYPKMPKSVLVHLQSLLQRYPEKKLQWYWNEAYALAGEQMPDIKSLTRTTPFLPSLKEHMEETNDRVMEAYDAMKALGLNPKSAGHQVLRTMGLLLQQHPSTPISLLLKSSYENLSREIPDWLIELLKK